MSSRSIRRGVDASSAKSRRDIQWISPVSLSSPRLPAGPPRCLFYASSHRARHPPFLSPHSRSSNVARHTPLPASPAILALDVARLARRSPSSLQDMPRLPGHTVHAMPQSASSWSKIMCVSDPSRAAFSRCRASRRRARRGRRRCPGRPRPRPLRRRTGSRGNAAPAGRPAARPPVVWWRSRCRASSGSRC